MTLSDFNQRPETPGESDPLSATGMFLRAFDSGTPPPSEDPAVTPSPAPKQSPAATPQPSGPGEFTRIFQGLEPRQATPIEHAQANQAESNSLASPTYSAQPPAPTLKPDAPSGPGEGEFTRISVRPLPIPAPVAKAGVETTIAPTPDQPAPAAPPRLKGFSSPGVSDSASADSSFTQFFKAAPAKPATPLARANDSAYPEARSVPAQPSHAEASQAEASQAEASQAKPGPISWAPAKPIVHQDEGLGAFSFGSELKGSRSPQSEGLDNPSSATGMMNSFGRPQASASPNIPGPFSTEPESRQLESRQLEPRQPVMHSYKTEPLPNYRPETPPVQPKINDPGSEAGSVTQLIQRLSQTPREAPQQVSPVAQPQSNSGPGEFTRMISGMTMKAEPSPAASAPSPAPSGFFAPAVPPVAMPHIPKAPANTPPAFHAPAAGLAPGLAPGPVLAAPHVPAVKMEMPAMAAPKPTPLTIPAPQAKLPAMVPILLVVNTFLLIVLLVVVIFAMRK